MKTTVRIAEKNYTLQIGFGVYNKIQSMAFDSLPKGTVEKMRDRITKNKKTDEKVDDKKTEVIEDDYLDLLQDINLTELIRSQANSKMEIIRLALIEPLPTEEWLEKELDPEAGELIYEAVMKEIENISNRLKVLREKNSPKGAPSSKQ
jgi:hypothetical protein